MSVPKPNVAVSRAAPRRKQSVLVRRPADGFDRRSVLVELDQGFVAMQIPDHQFVVVAARCELLAIEGPLEPADFLLVACVLLDQAVVGAQVSAQDASVS